MIATKTKKNDPTYNLTITVTPKAGGKAHTITLSRPFSEWFDELGHFVTVPFQQMLATAVPAIGKLDSRRIVASKESMSADDSALDAVLAASSNDAADKNDTRRRKA